MTRRSRSPRTASAAVAVMLVGLTVLIGCSRGEPARGDSAPPAPVTTATGAGADSDPLSGVAPGNAVDGDGRGGRVAPESGDIPDQYVAPTTTPDSRADSLLPAPASESDRQAARDAATATATVWIRTAISDPDTWNTQLLATLTPIAQRTYDRSFDLSEIDATRIAGEITLSGATATGATASVPTDAGTLTLTVVRDDDTGDWATSALGWDPTRIPS